jgi:hypothetical protein
MKNKNDFKGKQKPPNELAQPRWCLHCQHEELEPVELGHTTGRPFIKRLRYTTLFNFLFPRQYLLFGWRCMECGYVMWFTARFLD